MTNGVDASYERTVQVQWVSGDTHFQETADRFEVLLGTVPPTVNWMVERLLVHYRPGQKPTDTFVDFFLAASDPSPFARREATQLAPDGGFVADGQYDFAADEASPVRFFASEQVLAFAPLYGAAGHPARFIVNAQVRVVSLIPGAGQAGSETYGIEPVTTAEQKPPHDPTWG